MLSLEEIETGSLVTHRNTGLRYSVVEAGDEEILLSPESDEMQDLVVPVKLFREEFVSSDRYSSGRGRSRRSSRGRRAPAQHAAPTGPKVKGKIKKLVRERGFGFVRAKLACYPYKLLVLRVALAGHVDIPCRLGKT